MSSPESTHRQTPVHHTDATEHPALRGDEAELFSRHAERLVRRVAVQVRAPHQTIEDACSFAWMQLLCHQPDERDQVLAWLTRTAVRQVWRLTKGEARVDLAEEQLDLMADPAATVEDRVEVLERLACVAALREDERELIAMQAAGWSLEEITAATGHSWRAVCRRLKRARRHLDEADAR